MEEKILFEKYLFGDGNEFLIDDMEFWADRIVILLKIRSHQLEKAVELSLKYCQIAGFRHKLLEKSNICPVLIYRLYQKGIFLFEEIDPFLRKEDSYLICYYSL